MTETTKTALQWALGYIHIGWHVVPLKPGTKQPASWLVPNGVHGATCEPEKARAWWTAHPDCGIGIAVLPSKLVCVDIDPRNGGFETMERLEGEHGALVSDVLQFTGGGGEHRIFSSAMVANLPGKMGPGVDLKADGYFCAEPSIHPNGKTYGWEASSDPQEGCLPSTLPGWVRDLSRAPSAGGSLEAAVGSRFVSPEQVLELKEALGFIDCDDYHGWIAVGQALRSAGAAGFGLWDAWSQRSEKYDPSTMGKKWRSFAPRSLNLETVFYRAQQGGWVNPMGKAAQAREQALLALAEQVQQVRVYVPAEVATPITSAVVPFPVPMLDEVCHWICRTQGIAHGVAVQMAVISIAGLAASRLYVSEYGDGAHLYQLISAPSVGDLLPLHRAVNQVVRECGMRKMLREQRFTSQTALYRTLMRAPATLWLAAEWGTMSAFAKRQSSGLVDHVLNLMVNAFVQNDICLDNADELGFKGSAGIDDDMPMIRQPALSMLALTSETMLASSFAANEIGRGAVEQLMFHSANMVYQGEMQAEATPAWLVQRIRAIRALPAVDGADLDLASLFNGNAQLLPTQKVVRFEAKPEEHYPAFDAMCACSRAARPLANGARAMLKRLALTMAVWENHAQPVVTRAVLDWCAQFVAQRLSEALAALHFSGGSDDGKSSMYQTVLHHIAQAGSTGTTQTMAVRAIYKFRALPSAKRDELVAQLIEDGEVVEARNTNGKGTRLFVAAAMQDATETIAKHEQNTQNTKTKHVISLLESTGYAQNTQNTTTI